MPATQYRSSFDSISYGSGMRYIAHEAINSGRAVTEIDEPPQKAFLPGSLTLFLHSRLVKLLMAIFVLDCMENH
jgi:hypothetical protein